MGVGETISLIGTILACVVSVTAICTFFISRNKDIKTEAEKQYNAKADLEKIKSQNEDLLFGNREIRDKLSKQEERLTRIEQTVSDANLKEIPRQIAKLEERVKNSRRGND